MQKKPLCNQQYNNKLRIIIKYLIIAEEDVTIVYNLIKQVNPQIIYAAGDLTDPHGTHRVCLQAVLKAIDRLNKEEGFLSKCEVLLYRGAWQEYFFINFFNYCKIILKNC